MVEISNITNYILEMDQEERESPDLAGRKTGNLVHERLIIHHTIYC